jgi:hypothetical protein
MYVSGKTRPVETIPGMGEGRIKNGGGGDFKYGIFDILQELLHTYIVPQHNKTIILKNNNLWILMW